KSPLWVPDIVHSAPAQFPAVNPDISWILKSGKAAKTALAKDLISALPRLTAPRVTSSYVQSSVQSESNFWASWCDQAAAQSSNILSTRGVAVVGASATTCRTGRPNFRAARCTRSSLSQREIPGGNVEMTSVS